MTIDPTLAGLVTGALGLALLLSLLAVRALRARRRPVEAEVVEAEVEPAEPAAPRQRHTFWRLRRPRRTTSAGTSSDPVAETTATYDVLPEPELVEPLEEEPAEVEVVGGDREPLAMRSLRAQVRTLEQTIEDLRELTDRLPATEPAEAPAEEEPAAAYRRQVELSLRALAARPLPDESAAHALARAVAAVERLDGTDRLARPALPRTAGEPAAAPAVRVPAFASAPPAAAAAAAPPALVVPAAAVAPPIQPMVAVPTWTEPAQPPITVSEPAPEPDPADAVLDAVPVAVPEVEVVLPVPPPLADEPRRNRRWRRHAA